MTTTPTLPLPLPPAMPTEAEFQAAIVQAARRRGWVVNHTYRAKLADGTWRTTTTVRGWPDLTLIHPDQGRIVFLEVKKHRGDRDPDQLRTIALLQRVGGNVEAYFVEPTDWADVLDLLDPPTPRKDT